MAEDPLAQVEEILEGEAERLKEAEMFVIQVEKLAGISHEQAHEALYRYGQSMREAARQAGVSNQEWGERMSEARKFIVLGMTIGAMLAGTEIQFMGSTIEPDDD